MKANMKRCLAVARALVLAAAVVCLPALAQETVCARVKIEIKQELTLERQAFDAEMRITNTLPSTALDRVHVDVWVTDEAGQPITGGWNCGGVVAGVGTPGFPVAGPSLPTR